jgi:hypothetical protein
MKNKHILYIATALALASVSFYYYRKRKANAEYKKSVEEMTQEYDVFN